MVVLHILAKGFIKLKDITDYRQQAMDARRQIEYLKERIENVKKALDTEKNKTLQKALEKDLKTLNSSMTKETNKLNVAEKQLRR
jgi:hypothetical protein